MRVALVDPIRDEADRVTGLLKARHDDVMVFSDGLEALAHLRADANIAALITSDQPVSISGIELCWEARLLAGAQRPLYVMLMSAADDRSQLIEALDCGADDLLSKPLVADELYARLRVAERLASMQCQLIQLATTDSLTGMFNRRAFFDNAAALCLRAKGGYALSAIMIDIDHFKRINDRYGHDAGDEAIRAVAQVAMSERGMVGRLGGEEFAVLLDRPMGDAVEIAERFRRAIESLVLDGGREPVTMTASFGVSQWRQDDSIDGLLKRADIALYEAKLNGRNRVVAAADGLISPTYNGAGRPIRTPGARRS